MSCPPGTILNPRTSRCIKKTGKVAKELVQAGYITEWNIGINYRPPSRTERKTRRNRNQNRKNVVLAPPVRRPCPPGKLRNPDTGRCITKGGDLYHKLQLEENVAPRTETMPIPAALPVGSASVVPLAERSTLLAWISATCKNKEDPLRKKLFEEATDEELHEVIRLHNGKCFFASSLHDHIVEQHKHGTIATIPAEDKDTHLTLDDFHSLRTAMRRKNPGYKLPSRKHQPPPPEWQLYIASDNRSGEEFASVLYIDVTEAVITTTGTEYPVDSVRIDFGFIPIDVPTGTLCTAQTLVDIIQRLSQTHRLVLPVAGGWIPAPTSGFPFTKKFWETEKRAKVNKVCQNLVRILTTPI
jgi:hypothetical protein